MAACTTSTGRNTSTSGRSAAKAPDTHSELEARAKATSPRLTRSVIWSVKGCPLGALSVQRPRRLHCSHLCGTPFAQTARRRGKARGKARTWGKDACPWPSPRCVVSVLLGRYVPYAALADFVPAAAVVVAAAAQGLSAQLAAPGGNAGCSYAAASAAVVSCGQRVKVVHVVQVEGTRLCASNNI